MKIKHEDYTNIEEFIQILLKNNIIIDMQEDCFFEDFARELLRLAFIIDNALWLHLANLLIRFIKTSPYFESNGDAHLALAMLTGPETVLEKLFEK